jgi:hypothetical protein
MPLPATAIAERRTASRALPCQLWIADLADHWDIEAVTERDYVGLQMPLSQVAVSPAENAPALLGYADARLSCSMADLHRKPGYIEALAILSAGPVAVREIRGAEEVLGG